jgi:hypothetical protein
MQDLNAPLVAYRERERGDPVTGRTGILRDEWRVVERTQDIPVESGVQYEARLREHFGPQARLKPFILEHRYIRRGHEELWTPMQMANSRGQALEYIDDNAVAVDPALKALQEVRAVAAQAAKAAAAAEAAERREQEQRNEREHLSNDCFTRMTESKLPRYRDLADQWDPTIRLLQQRLAALRADKEWMVVYDAVYEAITMPSKAKAMRLFYRHPRTVAALEQATKRGRSRK